MAANGEYRVGVVGATGAVGSTILEVLAERRFPVAELRPLASARSAGSKVKFAGSRARGAGADRRVDPGPRPDPLLRGRQGELRVGAEVDRRRRGGGRQHQLLADARGRPARRRAGQRRRGRGPQRPGRQPELHDDGADGRPQADPRRGRDRAADRLDLPVGLRHRPAGDQGAPRAVRGRARGQAEIEANGLSRTRSPST